MNLRAGCKRFTLGWVTLGDDVETGEVCRMADKGDRRALLWLPAEAFDLCPPVPHALALLCPPRTR